MVHNEKVAAGIPCLPYGLLAGIDRQADFCNSPSVLNLKPVERVVAIFRNGEEIVKIAGYVSQFHLVQPRTEFKESSNFVFRICK
jgi:hypothetical protein